MRKAFKIAGITLAALVVIVLLAAGIVLHVVFTPKRLTPIVNQVADSLVTCPHSIEDVNLTFFSTFPDFGVSLRGVYIINPTEGAQSDTVLAIPELIASVDLMKAIDGDIIVHECRLKDIEANIFVGDSGLTNYDVLKWESDTTAEDSTEGSWKLRSIVLEQAVSVEARRLSFKSVPDSLDADLRGLSLTAALPSKTHATVSMLVPDISLQMKQTQYAEHARLSLDLPLEMDTLLTHFALKDARLALNQFEIGLTGTVATEDLSSGVYDCDLHLTTNTWEVNDLLALAAPIIGNPLPKGTELDGGALRLTAHAQGVLDSVQMPLVDAQLTLTDARGHYDQKVLPYYFDEIALQLSAHADLNNRPATTATIERLYARTGKTSLTATGSATEILKAGDAFELDNPLCRLESQVCVQLKDAECWVHSDSVTNSLNGEMKGNLSVCARLNDITASRWNKVQLTSQLHISPLDVIWQDSTLATADGLDIRLSAPKKGTKMSKMLTADVELEPQNLHAQLLASQLDALIPHGVLTGAIEMDLKDTTHMPKMEFGFNLDELSATMDTISLYVQAPKGKVMQKEVSQRNSKPQMKMDFSATSLKTNLGDATRLKIGKMSVHAEVIYNAKADNMLLKWSPQLRLALNNAEATIPQISSPLRMPRMKFNYSNRVFDIDTIRTKIQHSDFSLGGRVEGLGKWLEHKGDLTGVLRFHSEQTNVNELLAILDEFNRHSGVVATDSVEAQEADSAQTESAPFMVPDHVDLTLETRIKKAFVGEEVMQNLGGNLYIRDGQIVLEEIGFICEAAKLQLTAIYRTPRTNHLFVGLDFHMVDIDLQHLISMIPQLDTMVPMLRQFRGKAQFHVAAETYLTSQYRIKQSTLRGACSVEGKDLVLLDTETFEKISKILLFSPKTQNLIDSISVQIALYKDMVTVYPFCLSIDNYMAALGGNHYMDMNFDYHASLLKPFYIGVDVSGNFDDLKIKPAKCRYAQDFRPIIHKDTETQSTELRRMISDSLKKNVKIK